MNQLLLTAMQQIETALKTVPDSRLRCHYNAQRDPNEQWTATFTWDNTDHTTARSFFGATLQESLVNLAHAINSNQL